MAKLQGGERAESAAEDGDCSEYGEQAGGQQHGSPVVDFGLRDLTRNVVVKLPPWRPM
jgi:hypothetical protein